MKNIILEQIESSFIALIELISDGYLDNKEDVIDAHVQLILDAEEYNGDFDDDGLYWLISDFNVESPHQNDIKEINQTIQRLKNNN